ncbi:chaperonin 10-like protein [Lipomyces japonicus]|uniref:chaperonin 10-like protein n=1 Tax=Lipomyces japonicus TaxID=56871 RepID=UPI0034CFBD47
MTSQTAIVFNDLATALKKQSLPILEPGKNQILIKVTAAGLNPLDQKIRDAPILLFVSKLPAVLSCDVAGIVVKAGENATRFPIGTHIFGQSVRGLSAGGGLQEYTIFDERYASIVPADTSDLDATLLPTNVTTSAYSLFSAHGLNIPFPGTPESQNFDYKSQKIVIIGGGTNTGKLAIQLARIAGIGTIVVTASVPGNDDLKQYGATHVIDRQASNVETQVRDIVGDDLVYVYDTFNTDLSLAVSVLSNSKKGTVARIVPGPPVDPEAVATVKKAGFEEKQVFGFANAIPEFGKLLFETLPRWVENGDLKPLPYNIIEGLDAEKINAALDGYKSGNYNKWQVRL